MDRALYALAISPCIKNLVPNLQYRPRTWLLRGTRLSQLILSQLILNECRGLLAVPESLSTP